MPPARDPDLVTPGLKLLGLLVLAYLFFDRFLLTLLFAPLTAIRALFANALGLLLIFAALIYFFVLRAVPAPTAGSHVQNKSAFGPPPRHSSIRRPGRR
jgi:hypothetical protein